MSAVVKLASTMPADLETNGLDSIAQELIDNPKDLRAAFVVFDTQKSVHDTDTGEEIPTVRIRRFEPLGAADEVSQAIRDAYTVAVENRTGRQALPLDVVEVAEQGEFDGDEGEL